MKKAQLRMALGQSVKVNYQKKQIELLLVYNKFLKIRGFMIHPDIKIAPGYNDYICYIGEAHYVPVPCPIWGSRWEWSYMPVCFKDNVGKKLQQHSWPIKLTEKLSKQ